MKIIILLCSVLLISACSSNESVYNETQQKQLDKLGVLEYATSDKCVNSDSIRKMLPDKFDKDNVKMYCDLVINSSEGVNELIDKKLQKNDIQTYLKLDNFHSEYIDRYIAYPSTSIKDKVLNVNMNMDLAPYSVTNYYEDDKDVAMLINKYNSLPVGYIPNDLVDVNYVCTQGVDFSCSTMARMQLRKEAADAYEKFAKSANENGLNMVAIATYRSYEYQLNLYNYNKELMGIEYADAYYARAGQSEHNSGLAVDITFNGYPYNEIEKYEGYDWILKNMHKYGFILRYPEDKVEITKYGYESWHLRYVGKEVAKTIYENNSTLEEYYGER